MKNVVNIILIVAIIVVASSFIIKKQPSDVGNSSQDRLTQEDSPMPSSKSLAKPDMLLEEGKLYTITLHTTEGDIAIELDSKNTPITANNFYYLAKEGFYDKVIFHRVIPGFMIQGGDPTGTGTGSPGYKFEDEPFQGEYTRGTVAMANSGPNTNGSQFFIMHADYPLPPNYVIFGHVASGLEVVDKIATAETEPGGEGSRPVNPVVIESASIDVK